MGESEEAHPASVPFAAPGQSGDALSQGLDSATELNPGQLSSAAAAGSTGDAAMPLGLEGWVGGHMPGVFGVAEGTSGTAPLGEQPAGEQGDGAQADFPAAREYTINGKRK